MGNRKKVFIASSSDLEDERKELKELLYDENFEPILWEDIDHSITHEEFQERINNKHLLESDIVIFMIKSRLGKFTKEEFDLVYNKLSHNEIKRMYVYIFPGDTNKDDFDELNKINDLKKQLESDGKLWVSVNNSLELKNHFLQQIKYINKVEKVNTDICNSDTKAHIKILLTISVLISKAECNKYNICIEYQELKRELMKNDYDETIINTSLSFLIIKDFIDKGKMINNDLEEIEYIKLLPKAHKVIVQQSELLKQIKES